MIGILVVTHGNLGKEIIKSAELIMGKQGNIDNISLNLGDDIDSLQNKIKNKLKNLFSDESEVIVLTDLYGGSPSNAVLYSLKDLNFQAISGVNLPLLLELLNQRMVEKNINNIIDNIINAGVTGIKHLNEEIKKI